MNDLLERIDRNARFYENEAKAFRPQDCRHLGPEECKAIALLLREAQTALTSTEGAK